MSYTLEAIERDTESVAQGWERGTDKWSVPLVSAEDRISDEILSIELSSEEGSAGWVDPITDARKLLLIVHMYQRIVLALA